MNAERNGPRCSREGRGNDPVCPASGSSVSVLLGDRCSSGSVRGLKLALPRWNSRYVCHVQPALAGGFCVASRIHPRAKGGISASSPWGFEKPTLRNARAAKEATARFGWEVCVPAQEAPRNSKWGRNSFSEDRRDSDDMAGPQRTPVGRTCCGKPVENHFGVKHKLRVLRSFAFFPLLVSTLRLLCPSRQNFGATPRTSRLLTFP